MTEELKPQASAAQSAPDEREAFEAAYAKSQGIAEKAYPLWFERHGDGYTSSSVNASWWGWQQHGSWQRAQSAPVVPEGWRLVPDGPTTEMRLAGNRAINEAGALLCGISLRQVYDAMLAAAPQPAAQEIGELRVRLENGHKQFEFEEYSIAYALPDGTHYLYAAPQPAARQEQGDEAQELRELLIIAGAVLMNTGYPKLAARIDAALSAKQEGK